MSTTKRHCTDKEAPETRSTFISCSTRKSRQNTLSSLVQYMSLAMAAMLLYGCDDNDA